MEYTNVRFCVAGGVARFPGDTRPLLACHLRGHGGGPHAKGKNQQFEDETENCDSTSIYLSYYVNHIPCFLRPPTFGTSSSPSPPTSSSSRSASASSSSRRGSDRSSSSSIRLGKIFSLLENPQRTLVPHFVDLPLILLIFLNCAPLFFVKYNRRRQTHSPPFEIGNWPEAILFPKSLLSKVGPSKLPPSRTSNEFSQKQTWNDFFLWR